MQATFKLSPPVSQNGLRGIAKRKLREKEQLYDTACFTNASHKTPLINCTCRVQPLIHFHWI